MRAETLLQEEYNGFFSERFFIDRYNTEKKGFEMYFLMNNANGIFLKT